jgi:hypothetical protein
MQKIANASNVLNEDASGSLAALSEKISHLYKIEFLVL